MALRVALRACCVCATPNFLRCAVAQGEPTWIKGDGHYEPEEELLPDVRVCRAAIAYSKGRLTWLAVRSQDTLVTRACCKL